MTEHSKDIKPVAAPLTPETADPNDLFLMDTFDPVALSGTTNPHFAERLAGQVAGCQLLSDQMTARKRAEVATSGVAALKALAPANAVEAMLAAQAVAAHNASLDLLQLAIGNRHRRKESETFARQHARLSNVVLRTLDQLVRLRGRQRQTIRIEHVRVSDDGKVTVRQEEERVRG